MSGKKITIDGNEAASFIAYKASEVIAIYPITPSSPMGEWADAWAAVNKPNLWGTIPLVQEMQSEGGAAGAVHGALQAGSLATTFTASQGLMLMLPNMYKIAGELTPCVFHVAARSLAAQALSIFGDHSDVMAARMTGFALLASNSVQEVMDMALVSHAATLESRVPFLHFFDGFRTSHEVAKIDALSDDDIRELLNDDLIRAHRERALTPDRPVLRGTAQNPDVYFQGREAANKFYDACPEIVQRAMNKLAERTGRRYHLFDYHGSPEAERVVVLMGSGAETARETVDALMKKGEKVGVLQVRLYRPFSVRHFMKALPTTVRSIAALDRTKEPGSLGEPLYLDVVNALSESDAAIFKQKPRVIGGRYGLSSKEFTPSMINAVFEELKKDKPKNHFTVGINDDVTNTSLGIDPTFSTEPADQFRAVFYGLGADGTVGANKNTIKIIGDTTDNFAQGYFVYDSKKSGSMTISHLRFGPAPIRSTYLIQRPHFVGCHQWMFVGKYDMLKDIEEGGTFLLNTPFPADQIWNNLPVGVQRVILQKKLKFFVIDAYKVAKEVGLGTRVNTIMQTCFFSVSKILPLDKAIESIKTHIHKSYGSKGEEIERVNYLAIDQALAHLQEVNVPATLSMDAAKPAARGDGGFAANFIFPILEGRGDEIPVSAMPCDGTFPTGTAKLEKRNIAQEIPVWDEKVCIQCGKCVLVCPHAVIRAKVVDPALLKDAPAAFKSVRATNRVWNEKSFTLQVAPEDCTGCALCVDICPAKNKSETRLKAINMQPQAPLLETEKKNWDFFLSLPEVDRRSVAMNEVRSTQFLEPLFEFSGACAGCGETPYVKLLSQLFGERALIANATGCSSIYGGNLPTTPWTKNAQGRGPAWSNSLFEDNAEFGLGFRLSVDKQTQMARELVIKMESKIGSDFAAALLGADQKDEASIYEQRERVSALKEKLKSDTSAEAKSLLAVADNLVKRSVWILGGDGWAYDIGFGGLDHVLASGRDVNILVLDTEVYSNTGGQMSKATPRAAVAKFASAGKPLPKKDLGMIAMSYGHVYVASIAMGARDDHSVRAFLEAEAYKGPSLIIAYSHCIAHGINMTTGMRDQKLAVQTGYWPLYRYNPDLLTQGKNPLQIDAPAPSVPLKDFIYKQNRFKMLTKSHPEQARVLLEEAQRGVTDRWKAYAHLAAQAANGQNGAHPQQKPEDKEKV